MTPPLWPHQQRGFDEVTRHLTNQVRRVCLTSPTGGGKSRLMLEVALWAVKLGLRVQINSPRKLLTDQLIGAFQERQLRFGVMASGYREYEDLGAYIQIASPLTIESRVNKYGTWERFPADLLIEDERHMQTGGVCNKLRKELLDDGAQVLGVTATPVGLAKEFDKLVIAGTTSELRKTGALLPAYVYDPGCPNLDKIKRNSDGEFVKKDLAKAQYYQTIYASVVQTYKARNPERRPAILFAPGVAESKWFVDRLCEAGIIAAHIDGEDIYRDGQDIKRSKDAKDELIEDVRKGRVHVLCNRFVCREGVDIPELYYAALACPIGSLAAYLQVCGRILRNHESMDHVIIADHGGNARRHGSPNEDRDWNTLWQFNSRQIENTRTRNVEEGNEDPGTSCKKCGMMFREVPKNGLCLTCNEDLSETYACPQCNHKHAKWPMSATCEKCGANMRRTRKKPVIEVDGTLRYVPDEAFKDRRPKEVPGSQKLWNGIFWGHRKHKPTRTFNQLYATFKKKHYEQFRCTAPRNLKLMPKSDFDWNREVGAVELEDLR